MKEKLPEKKAEVAKNEANREHPAAPVVFEGMEEDERL